MVEPVLPAPPGAEEVNAWTARHPLLKTGLAWCYLTLIAQLLLPLVGLWFGERDQAALWEYTFNFFVCSSAVIVIVTLFPAACPMTFYGFQPLLPQGNVARQIIAIRSGALTLIQFAQLDGLISFPSFHTAGALMVTWAFRHKRWFLLPLILINVGLISATFLMGAHYFVDTLGGVALFAASTGIYRRIHPLLDVP